MWLISELGEIEHQAEEEYEDGSDEIEEEFFH